MNRREFGKASLGGAALLGLASFGGLAMTGCNSLADYLQVAVDGVDSLFTLLGLPTTNPLVKDVNAAFGAAIAGANKYGSDNVAGDPVLVSLLDAVDTALQTFLAQANIPSGLVTLILSAIEIVIGTIEGWIAKPPSTLKVKSGKPLTVVVKKRTASQFRSAWDSVVTLNNHPELRLK